MSCVIQLGYRPRGQTRAIVRTLAVVAFAGAGAAAVVLITRSSSMGDYRIAGPVAGDNPGPAITALAHLHLGALASNQPLMGLTSILLRAPLVALTSLLGGGDVLAYRLGAIACLVPAGLLAGWLVARRGATSRERLAGAFGAILVLASPAAVQAIQLGHPEEVLAIALATAAVLAAVRGRATPAAILLGLAVGTKQWALLAAPVRSACVAPSAVCGGREGRRDRPGIERDPPARRSGCVCAARRDGGRDEVHRPLQPVVAARITLSGACAHCCTDCASVATRADAFRGICDRDPGRAVR